MNNVLFNKQIILIFIYAFIYIFIIPWDFSALVDYNNYLGTIRRLARYGDTSHFTGYSIIVSEALWRMILMKFSEYPTYYEDLLRLVSFFDLFIYTLFTSKRVNIFFIIVFFFNPIFMDLVMSQLRMATAFSLLIIAFMLDNKKIQIALLISAIMIHTATIVFIGVYYILYLFQSILKSRKLYLYALILAFVIALFLKYGVDSILVPLGDKRAHYSEIISGNSIKYSIFWFFASLVLVLKSKYHESDLKLNLIISFSIVMMSLFFFSSVLGSYGERYVAVSIPLIVISIYVLPKNYSWALFFVFFVWQLIQMFYWLDLYEDI